MTGMRCAALVVALAVACAAGASAAEPAEVAARPGPPWQARLDADHPFVGIVFDGRSGEPLTPDAALDRLAGARFVLLGERHDHPDHHRLQAWVIERMAARGRRPLVVLEMLDDDQARAAQERGAAANADAWAEAVGWSRSGWPEFALYRPVIAAALAAGLDLAPGSLSRTTLRRVAAPARDAEPDPEASALRGALGLDAPLDPALRDAMAREIERGHCGHAPADLLPRMVETQRVRDARLAEAMTRAPASAGAVLVAGAGHTRTDRGAPLHLRALAPDGGIASLVFAEVRPGLDDPRAALDPEEGQGPHDLVWFTPRLDDDDPCERFREPLRRLGPRAPGAGTGAR